MDEEGGVRRAGECLDLQSNAGDFCMKSCRGQLQRNAGVGPWRGNAARTLRSLFDGLLRATEDCSASDNCGTGRMGLCRSHRCVRPIQDRRHSSINTGSMTLSLLTPRAKPPPAPSKGSPSFARVVEE